MTNLSPPLRSISNDILNALIAVSDGKIWAQELPFRGSQTRIDFWTLAPTPSEGFRAEAYEIKVSRADFKRDGQEKQEGALRYSDRFWYVCPEDVLTKHDMPEWAGLMTFDGKEFRVRKIAPKRQKLDPDWGVVADIIRNSGQCQRDTALLKSENAFLKFETKKLHTQLRDISDVRHGRFMGRWGKRNRPHLASPELQVKP